jgi:competence protein ComEC
MRFFRRYGLVLVVAVYSTVLIGLHVTGRFPSPGVYDVSRLIGTPALTLEGRVLTFPQTRWDQTRFFLEGRAQPLQAYHGRLAVECRFPMDDLVAGERIRIRGWLYAPRVGRGNAFDERGYWAGNRVFAGLRVWSPEAVARLNARGPQTWTQRACAFHQRFQRFWFNRLPPSEAAVLCCMTVGSRGILPGEIKNQFIRAGIYHILVVSGQNVAFIIMISVACLQLMRIPRRHVFWICALPVMFYAAVVGSDPPVLRAATMALVTLSVLALGRDTPRYIPVAAAGLAVLVRQPEVLFGASFQLSFGATVSLLAFWSQVRRLQRIRSRVLRWFAEVGALSFAVHAGLWPLLAFYFHQISLIGFVANWTVFPISAFLMITGLFMGVWGMFSPATIPDILIQGMHGALSGLLLGVGRLSRWTWAAVPLAAPPPWVLVVYYVGLIGILWRFENEQKTPLLQQSRDRL